MPVHAAICTVPPRMLFSELKNCRRARMGLLNVAWPSSLIYKLVCHYSQGQKTREIPWENVTFAELAEAVESFKGRSYLQQPPLFSGRHMPPLSCWILHLFSDSSLSCISVLCTRLPFFIRALAPLLQDLTYCLLL